MKRYSQFIYTALLLILMVLIFNGSKAYAASGKFKYTNKITKETLTYEGTVPVYYLDKNLYTGTQAKAIISEGYAFAPVEVFADGLGIEYAYDTDTMQMRFYSNDTELIMYVNSDLCYINGEESKAPKIPFRFKYSKSKITTNLVPSRFVAETLHYGYEWIQATGSVEITSPEKLEYKNDIHYYLGTLGKLNVNGNNESLGKYPSVIINDNAMINITKLKNCVNGLTYDFDKSKEELSIKYKDITIRMFLNSTMTYVNGFLDFCPEAPLRIINHSKSSNGVYIPGRYVFETLGFCYEWKTDTTYITALPETGQYTIPYENYLIFDSDLYIHDNLPTDNINYRQELIFPILEGIKPELINMHDYFYDNLVSFDLPGNYLDYYRDNPIKNTGEAVIQLQIIYFEPEDITRINIYTRTDENNIILGHTETSSVDSITFTFDRNRNLFDKIIILDAGHGGTDSGATSGKTLEKDLNFDIVYNYCKKLFDKSDIKVYYSRYSDYLVPLHDRPALSARVDADFFISVHQNSFTSYKHGTEVYYSVKNTGNFNGMNSLALANLMFKNLTEGLNSFPSRVGGDRNYVVVSEENAVPSVILEIGYISNPEDLEKILKAKYRKKVAQIIYDSVVQIYNTYK